MKNQTNKDGLSPSSLALFQSCARRYFHYKIAKTPHDSDYVDDVESLKIGSAFHKVCENNLHNLNKLKYSEVADVCVEHELDHNTYAPLIYAMCLKYRETHNDSKLKVEAVEIEIHNDGFLGYVDAVMSDKNGYWIADLKTSASYRSDIVPTLNMHPQLNLYAAFAPYLAEKLKLKGKFLGCRYRLTTKSKIKRKDKEDTKAFVQRLMLSIVSHDIVLPIETMKPSAILDIHNNVSRQILLNGGYEEAYCRNYNSCYNYFRPCQWFSKCHGVNYSERLPSNEQ